ncbi:hypothetical protein BBJ28_00004124 [Nothophytophthora sp. Chile5]|nr:hypothetical protein BBJ28_00004124 [Nothophytophthora sp. Chile5]
MATALLHLAEMKAINPTSPYIATVTAAMNQLYLAEDEVQAWGLSLQSSALDSLLADDEPSAPSTQTRVGDLEQLVRQQTSLLQQQSTLLQRVVRTNEQLCDRITLLESAPELRDITVLHAKRTTANCQSAANLSIIIFYMIIQVSDQSAWSAWSARCWFDEVQVKMGEMEGSAARGDTMDAVDANTLSYEDFCERYMSRNRPVLLRNVVERWFPQAAQWKTSAKDNHQINIPHLREHYGDAVVPDRFGRYVVPDVTAEHVDEEKFPHFHEATPLNVIQEAGDAIFVPSGWYHQVKNLEDTISINHNWFNGYNLRELWGFFHRELTAVERELEDLKALGLVGREFLDQCQLVMRANTGINYVEFRELLYAKASELLARHERLEEETAAGGRDLLAHLASVSPQFHELILMRWKHLRLLCLVMDLQIRDVLRELNLALNVADDSNGEKTKGSTTNPEWQALNLQLQALPNQQTEER